MTRALYTKYRSKSLDGIIGQDHITKTLQNAIKSGQISHAYLFTGPRGVGKTSIARILAHAINGFDYDSQTNYIDIIEIDAASNRGIEEIRDLREKVAVAPVQGKYKVYIIDEVHMMTTAAFNALLKTLEEPPAHVVFILATTEAHKIPATIISRTQRHNFRPISTELAVAHLADIAAKEDIQAEPAALELVAEHGDGSFRDSISLLEQLAGSGQAITAESVKDTLGLAPSEFIDNILNSVAAGNPAAIAKLIDEMTERGFAPNLITKDLFAKLRQMAVGGKATLAPQDCLNLMEALVEVSASKQPSRLLQVALIRAALANSSQAFERQSVPLAVEPKETSSSPEKSNTKSPESGQEAIENPKKVTKAKAEAGEKSKKQEAQPAAAPTQPAVTKSVDTKDIGKLWAELLTSVKANHNTLHSILRMAQPSLEKDDLKLAFNYSFHVRRMSDTRNQTIVKETFKQLTGQPVNLICELSEQPVPPPVEAEVEIEMSTTEDNPPVDKSQLATISNIFGGGELLES